MSSIVRQTNGNTDSGIESDPDMDSCTEVVLPLHNCSTASASSHLSSSSTSSSSSSASVLLVVDSGNRVITSRDNNNNTNANTNRETTIRETSSCAQHHETHTAAEAEEVIVGAAQESVEAEAEVEAEEEMIICMNEENERNEENLSISALVSDECECNPIFVSFNQFNDTRDEKQKNDSNDDNKDNDDNNVYNDDNISTHMTTIAVDQSSRQTTTTTIGDTSDVRVQLSDSDVINECATEQSIVVGTEAVPPPQVTTEEMAAEMDAEKEEEAFSLVDRESEERVVVRMEAFSDYERKCLNEFFDGSQKGKTADSYVQIRNHFIRHWMHIRPRRFGYHDMLRKVGYLHLGNVTAFSRVQKFLESHDVINNGTGSKRLKKELTGSQKSSEVKKQKQSYTQNQMKKLGLQCTQALRNGNGNAQAGEASTQTMDTTTTSMGDSVAKVQSSSRTRPNPFKLVPLETYDQRVQAPFALRLSMEALAIIDIHSHMVRTEVIGLLGGLYCQKTQQLYILTAEPCASLDDHDLQCDMEPVSQALAKERLEQKKYQVVGWYHSHPTFVPNPSLRDLETQFRFQELFSRESAQPFVALILSPYMTSCAEQSAHRKDCLVSKFKCLFVSQQTNAQNDYKIPYELCPQIIRREKLMFAVQNKLTDLCLKTRGHASKVQMLDKVKRFRGMDITNMDKLCHSLRHYMSETGLSDVECDHMLDNCKEILLKHMNDTTPTATTTTTTATDDDRQRPTEEEEMERTVAEKRKKSREEEEEEEKVEERMEMEMNGTGAAAAVERTAVGQSC